MWVASTHSRAGLIKLEKQGWVFLWILDGLQSPRSHGDWTPVRPHNVSYKVSISKVCRGKRPPCCHCLLFHCSCSCSFNLEVDLD